MKRDRLFWRVLTYIALAIMLIISLFPVYWIIITSFKANSEIFSLVPSMFPQQPTLDGYNELLNNSDF
ncbi:MAG: carbohydrate ABC transporter permease, partial [Anaerolineae bacterium]|nr:carbohydrate ABC transporter permease [Anaerolineae bacterium]